MAEDKIVDNKINVIVEERLAKEASDLELTHHTRLELVFEEEIDLNPLPQHDPQPCL